MAYIFENNFKIISDKANNVFENPSHITTNCFMKVNAVQFISYFFPDLISSSCKYFIVSIRDFFSSTKFSTWDTDCSLLTVSVLFLVSKSVICTCFSANLALRILTSDNASSSSLLTLSEVRILRARLAEKQVQITDLETRNKTLTVSNEQSVSQVENLVEEKKSLMDTMKYLQEELIKSGKK